MATALITVDCKLFQMMPYLNILKVRKFHQPSENPFNTAREKPVGGGAMCPPSLNRVNNRVAMETIEITYILGAPYIDSNILYTVRKTYRISCSKFAYFSLIPYDIESSLLDRFGPNLVQGLNFRC